MKKNIQIICNLLFILAFLNQDSYSQKISWHLPANTSQIQIGTNGLNRLGLLSVFDNPWDIYEVKIFDKDGQILFEHELVFPNTSVELPMFAPANSHDCTLVLQGEFDEQFTKHRVSIPVKDYNIDHILPGVCTTISRQDSCHENTNYVDLDISLDLFINIDSSYTGVVPYQSQLGDHWAIAYIVNGQQYYRVGDIQTDSLGIVYVSPELIPYNAEYQLILQTQGDSDISNFMLSEERVFYRTTISDSSGLPCDDVVDVGNTMPLAVKIYPNPTGDYIFIEGLGEDFIYSIIDMSGKKVLYGSLFEYYIDLSVIPSGAYFINFTKGDLIFSTKLIKK